MLVVSGGLARRVVIAVAAVGAWEYQCAQAADVGGDCCSDLEDRVAEFELTTARAGQSQGRIENHRGC
jgi:hypothetical protein